MLDRESTFADPKIVDLLKTRFIPVAIDQANQRRQQDTEGEFYRKIALQRRDLDPTYDGSATTQGFYVATAAGQLLLYNNNRDPAKLRRLMLESLSRFETQKAGRNTRPIRPQSIDARYHLAPPEGGLVLRVQAKVLGGYKPAGDRWERIFQTALSRDNLWVSASEHRALATGRIPRSLLQRIARFHLVDNTRGEPPMWRPEEIRRAELKIRDGKLSGVVHLRTDRSDRGYEAELTGVVEVANGTVVRFDMVALGEFWGQGRYTPRAPAGKFPLAISFTLSDGTDLADFVAPQAARGWLRGYLP